MRAALARLAPTDAAAAAAGADGTGAPVNMPRVGTGVTINSTSQKLAAKLERKAARRGAGVGGKAAGAGAFAMQPLPPRPPQRSALTQGVVTLTRTGV